MNLFASLAMYPFAPLRPAWDRLWAAVHEQLPWSPPSLTWDGEAQEHWTDRACVVAHVCGLPLATTRRRSVDVVGAFALALPEADGHRYRSVIVAARPDTLESFVTPATTLAANSDDSLSGWMSLRAAVVAEGSWPGRVRWTGSHLASVQALHVGAADLASIDELTWAYIGRIHPSLANGLHVVGRGPWVPGPAVVTSSGQVEELRQAFTNAMSDPATRRARAELLLAGFVALDHSDYAGVLRLDQGG
jgi:ABC-type phosphate/phosphonate transport system substrate-binding protein